MELLEKFDTFIFDLDDTIFDSEKRNIKYIFEFFKKKNINLDEEDKNIVFGHSWQYIYSFLKRKYNLSESVEKINKDILKIKFQDIKKHPLILNPGIKEFLNLLKKKKKKIAIVTGSCYKEAVFMLKSANLDIYFLNKDYPSWKKKYLIFAAGDYKESKPSPEGFLLALKILKAIPSKTLVFEDSKSGILAAKKAGCNVAFIKNFSSLLVDKLETLKPDYIFQDFTEILKSLFSKDKQYII